MTKYREILRLSALGLTLREIAASLHVISLKINS